jgi:acylpyruvate hydrolase
VRLASYQREGRWRAAVVRDGQLVDAGGASVRELLAGGRDAIERAGAGEPLGDVRLGPPVPDPGKILCIGLNYRPHAAEAEMEEPEVPLVFAKFANTLIGPGAPIRLPAAAPAKVDYEGEIAFVIGRRAHAVPEAEALDAIAGWMPFNDVSARDVQLQTSQWTVGKSPDTFGPCGPHLVLDDTWRTQGLALETYVNGERLQHAHTDEMIFSPARLVAFLSAYITLEPGDLIVSGTPEGVGAFRDPPIFLADGDTVEVRVGEERLVNPVTSALP